MKIIPCIIGLGYVGLPITLNLANSFVTYGFDKNKKRIENLKNKIDVNREFGPKKFDNVKKSTYYDVILFLSYHKIFKKIFQNIESSKNRNKILDPFNYYS